MAIDIVQTEAGSRLSEDWRSGVVEPRPGHVYGGTALGDVQWQQVDDVLDATRGVDRPDLRPHHPDAFAVEERPACCRPEPGAAPGKYFYHECPDRASAWALAHERTEKADRRAFDPDGPIRIVVREVFR